MSAVAADELFCTAITRTPSRAAAEKHERAVQYFKRKG